MPRTRVGCSPKKTDLLSEVGVEKEGAERLYFVVETKSSLFTDDLREKESRKIKCGEAHFKALEVREAPAKYVVARSVDEVLSGE